MTKFPPYPFTLRDTALPGTAQIGQSQAKNLPRQLMRRDPDPLFAGDCDLSLASRTLTEAAKSAHQVALNPVRSGEPNITSGRQGRALPMFDKLPPNQLIYLG